MNGKFSLKGGSGNLKGSRITKAPADLDPVVPHESLGLDEETMSEMAWEGLFASVCKHKWRFAGSMVVDNEETYTIIHCHGICEQQIWLPRVPR